MSHSRITAAVRLSAMATILSALAGPSAQAQDRLFTSSSHRLRFTAPLGWQLSNQTGYPAVLALLTRGSEARITVAALDSRPPRTARQLGLDSLTSLRARGLQILRTGTTSRGGFSVDAATGDGLKRLRQVHLSVGDSVYVFVFAAPATSFARLLPSLDELLRSLSSAAPASAGVPPSAATAALTPPAGATPGRAE